MKISVIFTLFLSLNLFADSTLANPNREKQNCEKQELRGLSKIPSAMTKTYMSKITDQLVNEIAAGEKPPSMIESVTSKVCGYIFFHNDNAQLVDEIIRNTITKETGITNPSRDQIASFWNENIDKMECKIGEKKVNIMHYPLYLDKHWGVVYSFYNSYLSEEIGRELNVNILVDGKTVVDKLDSKIDYYTSKIKSIKEEKPSDMKSLVNELKIYEPYLRIMTITRNNVTKNLGGKRASELEQ